MHYDSGRKIKANENFKIIKQKVEKDIIESLKLSKQNYKRDSLWQSLLHPGDKTYSLKEFKELLACSNVVPMEKIDPRIKDLRSLTDVYNCRCFDYLREVYKDKCRWFVEDQQPEMVIIWNPKLLAYIEIKEEDQKFNLFVIRKTSNYKLSDEQSMITAIVKHLLQWLWVRLTTMLNN